MAPWYKDGLCFECLKCGRCCTGAPGTVRVVDSEIEALATILDMHPAVFRKIYTRRQANGETSLREKSNHDCVLLDRERGCIVYGQRPRQCRTWPFWRSVVASPARWKEAARECPGIDQGPLYSAAHIMAQSTDDGTCGSVMLAGLPAEAPQAYSSS